MRGRRMKKWKKLNKLWIPSNQYRRFRQGMMEWKHVCGDSVTKLQKVDGKPGVKIITKLSGIGRLVKLLWH